MSFVQRKIEVTFQLGQGNFGDSEYNTVTVSGLRTQANIQKVGGATMGSLNLRIHGLTKSVMRELTDLWTQAMMQRRNRITVSAGDDTAGMSVVFAGTISQGWMDLNSAPDSSLHIKAAAGIWEGLKPVPPTSYPGAADVSNIMAGLAELMGLQYENNGVSVMLATPYLRGTARDQAMQVAEAANINCTIDDGVLAIWPKGCSRGGLVPVVSAATGMIGYPSHNGTGFDVSTLYLPGIRYGGQIKLESVMPNATGYWYVYGLSHDLESETPNGKWQTNLKCMSLANQNVVPQ